MANSDKISVIKMQMEWPKQCVCLRSKYMYQRKGNQQSQEFDIQDDVNEDKDMGEVEGTFTN